MRFLFIKRVLFVFALSMVPTAFAMQPALMGSAGQKGLTDMPSRTGVPVEATPADIPTFTL